MDVHRGFAHVFPTRMNLYAAALQQAARRRLVAVILAGKNRFLPARLEDERSASFSERYLLHDQQHCRRAFDRATEPEPGGQRHTAGKGRRNIS